MVPPGLLIRTIRARTCSSSSAFCSSSRTRAIRGTRGGGAPIEKLVTSSERTPERSSNRILLGPLPSTVSSSSGRIRGWRSSVISEHPDTTSSIATARTGRRRMAAVYGWVRPGPSPVGRSAAVILRADVLGHDAQLLEHAVGGSERAQDELGGARRAVLPDRRQRPAHRTEGGALAHGGLVHAAARDEGLGHRVRRVLAVGDRVVDQGAEMVLGHLTAFGRGQVLHLLDARAPLARRDEGRDPAIAEARGAPHRRLALAADPAGRRGLPGVGV